MTWKPKKDVGPHEGHLEAMARGAKCAECAMGCEQHRGPVMPQSVPGSGLVLIGEAPGEWEVKAGAVFAGKTGKAMERALRQAGASRHNVSVTNAAACWVGESANIYKARLKKWNAKREADGKPPLLDPWTACAPMVAKDIDEARDGDGKVTVAPLGGQALKSVAELYGYRVGAGSKKEAKTKRSFPTITRCRGMPEQIDDRTLVVPTMLPAYALRSAPHYMHIIADDIGRAVWLRGAKEAPEYPAVEFMPPEVATEEFADQCIRWMDLAVEREATIFCDIETDDIDNKAQIRCIGLGYFHEGTLSWIVIPLRYTDGSPYWRLGRMGQDAARQTSFGQDAAHQTVTAHQASFGQDAAQSIRSGLRRLLAACEVVFHNGAFDTFYLWRDGLWPRDKQFQDTMLAHKNSRECDALHGLGAVSSRFWPFPNWKNDVDHKAADNVQRDLDLWTYNGKGDIVATAVAHEGVQRWLNEDGTRPQYEEDLALAPIMRDMGRIIGVHIDEPRRAEKSEFVAGKIDERMVLLKEFAEDPDFNPRSVPQVKKLLYDKHGLPVPMLTKTGEPSTGIPALFKLQRLGLEPDAHRFVSALIQYRTLEKLRSSYLANPAIVDPAEDDDFIQRDDEEDQEEESVSLDGTDGRDAGLVNKTEWEGISRMHMHYKLLIPSGRVGCTPNLMNQPKRAAFGVNIRDMYCAPPGHVIISSDFEQLEARLYAARTQEPTVLLAIDEGRDLHVWNYTGLMIEDPRARLAEYERMMKIRTECKGAAKGTKEYELSADIEYRRLIAKIAWFGLIYGMWGDTLYEYMSSFRDKASNVLMFPNIDEQECQDMFSRFHQNHPNCNIWHSQVEGFVRQHGYLAAFHGGRRRYFPGGPAKKNAPYNHDIQSSAAKLTNDACRQIADEIPFQKWSPYSGLNLQVHDELCAIVPEARAEEARRIFNAAMEREVNGIRIWAEAETQKNWTKRLDS